MGKTPNNPDGEVTVPKRKPKAEKIDRQQQIAEAMDFRRQAGSHAEIADLMGKTVEEVIQLIDEGIEQTVVDPEEKAARLELQRVDAIIQGNFANAIGGDSSAAGLVMTAERRKRDLEQSIRMMGATTDATATASFLHTGDLMNFVPPEHRPPIRPIIGKFKNGKPKYGPAPKPDKGRPKHEPTEQSLKTVMMMASALVRREGIAAALCISVNTLDAYYSELIEAAPGLAVANLNAMMMAKAAKSESANKWLLERLSPAHRIERAVWGRDLHKEGGTGNSPAVEKAITIIGGLPQAPQAWLEPPGQAEAMAKQEAGSKDEFGSTAEVTALKVVGQP